ncbi:uncharacterized protein LOC129593210 [Paramacrobiotus metropolitanus]|uniref:uncharacterized protein LOC129593210 n=1 Tax=Paramacrobiotus metropolitanus TaxID=2943436 RepID=UPI0024460BB9|nr:uncharacterized protein LOC129593210 [Paramacrobiotus metropolitanus]
MLQTLAFVIFIPLYGIQLVCGARSLLAGVRLLRGQRNSAFLDEENYTICQFRYCQTLALMSSGMCLLALVFAWFSHVGLAANRLFWFARPKPEPWEAVNQAFQAELPGQMAMLAAVLLQIASVIVVVFTNRQSKFVRKDLESTKRNADDHMSSQEERKLLARSKKPSGPPPAYSAGKMEMAV